MRESSNEPRIQFNFEAGSNNTIINGGTFNAPVYTSPQEKKKPVEKAQNAFEDDEQIKVNIEKFMALNSKKNKRWWFAVYRVLKDNSDKCVDLNGFKCYIDRLFPEGLPVDINTHDLSKELELDCFAKPYSEWTPAKAPVQGKLYETWRELVEQFASYFA